MKIHGGQNEIRMQRIENKHQTDWICYIQNLKKCQIFPFLKKEVKSSWPYITSLLIYTTALPSAVSV